MKLILFIFTLLYSNLSLAKEWTFDAILNDKLIGQHTFIYKDDKTLSQANFEFEYFFMDFIYQHKSTETWDGNCLKSITSNTDDDGEIYDVDGRLGLDGFVVSLNNKTTKLPLCIMTFSYGNPKILEQKKLMNAQSGEYLGVDIQFLSQEDYILKGKNIKANLWQIKAEGENGDLLIHLWYDKNMQWVGLKSSTPIGDMHYKLR
jgi:hypothetical protein